MNNINPKFDRLINATLENVLAFSRYYLNAEKFDITNIRALDEKCKPLVIMTGVSMDEAIKFLISKVPISLPSEYCLFGAAMEEVGFYIEPSVYSVYHREETGPAVATGTIPKIWKWAKSQGLLERYVYERTPRISSDIGQIQTRYDEQGESQDVWIDLSSQLLGVKVSKGELDIAKELEQFSEQAKGLNLATPSLQLDDYSDYLSNQERWRAEIAELLTTVCPSVEIRRNHKTAPDLYAIHEGGEGFAVLHTLMFVRFLRSAKEDRLSFSGSELCSEWKNYLVRALTT